MAALAANHPADPIDVVIGDWMSEANMTARAMDKTGGAGAPAYEATFLEALEPALLDLARHGIKVAVNAGAADTRLLAETVRAMVARKGLGLKVAWVSGDEVLPAVERAQRDGRCRFENLCTGEVLRDWKFRPVYAQAYLGGLGIAAALAEGADIVVCGRVSDASPVIGAAYWWHGWKRDQLDELANAFVAGHLIECSTYVCGGNFTGFKGLELSGWEDIGYPIAEIAHDGQVVIAKSQGAGGEVSTQTCSSQLLYEIQGPWYFNSDVTAILTDLWFEQLGSNRVALRGVRADLPPATTKVGLTAPGGYQAEVHWFPCGLDIEAKCRMLETQIRRLLAPHAHRFTTLAFTTTGTAAEDARNQNAATVDFRIFVQAPAAADISAAKFARPCIDPIMQSYPGATFHLDLRQAMPKPIQEYYVTLLPQAEVQHRVHLWDGRAIEIAPPPRTRVFPAQQPSEAEATGAGSRDFGATTRGPLGWVVHARSGDKGSDCNVGFWVRHREEWQWLRSLLSVATVKGLLADEYKGKKIVSFPAGRGERGRGGERRRRCERFRRLLIVPLQDRFELPNMYAVHFLLHDHLDRGVSCSSSYDFLGKNVAEYLRSKHVDLPTSFLTRGKL